MKISFILPFLSLVRGFSNVGRVQFAQYSYPLTTLCGTNINVVDSLNINLPKVFFVLGGPGAGKGTQCERLSSVYGLLHLSAGELLRAERSSGSPQGGLIEELIREGKIVPSKITVDLIQKAMSTSNANRVLGIILYRIFIH